MRFKASKLWGGSAADDLNLKQAWLGANGNCMQDAAVVILFDSKLPFHVFKHQHFGAGKQDAVVAHAIPEAKQIITLDGIPAAERYGQLLGLTPDQLTLETFALNPLVFRTNNTPYVRSIGGVLPNGALQCYALVETGMILELGSHLDMKECLDKEIQNLKAHIKKPAASILFNCVFRMLEANNLKNQEDLSKMIFGAAPKTVGFNCYGEQYNGLSMNQTLTGVLIGE